MLTREFLEKVVKEDAFTEVAIAQYTLVKSMSRILEHGLATDLLRATSDFAEDIKNSVVVLVTEDDGRLIASVR